MGESRVILNADDFGYDAGVTRAIADCIDAGVLTSTTIMANMEATVPALAWAAERGRRASFGVHLNLCEGRPLTRATSLAGGDGNFHRKRTQALRAMTRRHDGAEIEAELRAQIERVLAGGVEVSHLDSHKHLHQLPGVGAITARLAAEFGIERVRCSREEGFWPAGFRASDAASRWVRVALARSLEPSLRRHGLRWPERVLDIAELMASADREAQLRLLRRPETTTEVFCHPGPAQATGGRAEDAYLRSSAFAELLRDAGVRLVTYWDL